MSYDPRRAEQPAFRNAWIIALATMSLLTLLGLWMTGCLDG